MNKKVLVRIIFFNLAETLIIFLLGSIFSVEINLRIMFMVLFFLTRMIIGNPKHYNKAYRCALWSVLVFLSLYSLSSLDIYAIILLTIFTAFISTGKADIKDMFLWEGEHSLNREVFEWVKYNQDNVKLKEYEEKLKYTDKKKYYIFKYRFREFKSYKQIDELMELGGTQRVTEELKIMSHFIEYSIRLG